MKYLVALLIGFGLGALEENLRYSILYHEAMKGDEESKEIIDQFETIGSFIENLFE